MIMSHECQSSDISGYDLILFEERKFILGGETLEALNYGMVEIERLSINCSVMMKMIMMMMNSW